MWRLYQQHQRDGLMHMNMFGLNTVLIGDFDTLKQVFSLSETTNRLTGTGMEALGREDRRIKGKHHPGDNMQIGSFIVFLLNCTRSGLVVSEGRTWTEQRRFTLRTLRDFGFGKQGMEDVILEEVELFKGLIDKHNGEPFDFKNQFNLPILNALWRVTSGERFEYDNQKFKSIVDRLTEMLQRIGNPSNIVIMLYPWITKIYPKFMDRDKTLRIQHEIMDFIEDSVRTHQENLDPAAPNDYTDTVLIEMERTRDPASSFYGEAGMENLTNSLMDLFLAGSETTSTTLTWAMLYMIRYPEIQAKVQAELDTVVGQNKAPTLQDRSSLPYTEVNLTIQMKQGEVNDLSIPPPAGSDDGGSAACQHPARGCAPCGQHRPAGGIQPPSSSQANVTWCHHHKLMLYSVIITS